jgi:hypothetical protein
LYLSGVGGVTLFWLDGTSSFFKGGTVSHGRADGEVAWIRGTLDVNNGAGGNTVRIYKGLNGVDWDLVETVTTAGTTTVRQTNSTMRIGGFAGEWYNGQVEFAEIRSGINGTVLATFNAADPGWATPGIASAVSAASGETWTLNGAATIVRPARTLTGLAEAVGTLDFTPDENFSEVLRFAVELQMADPFWYGDEVTGSVPFAGGGVYNPGSAIARKMFIQLNGPLTNPRLENQTPARPVSITYNGTIAGGAYVVLDTDLYTAYDNLGINQISKINHSGAHSWMELAPGGNVLLFTVGTGSGSADFTFSPPYL